MALAASASRRRCVPCTPFSRVFVGKLARYEEKRDAEAVRTVARYLLFLALTAGLLHACRWGRNFYRHGRARTGAPRHPVGGDTTTPAGIAGNDSLDWRRRFPTPCWTAWCMCIARATDRTERRRAAHRSGRGRPGHQQGRLWHPDRVRGDSPGNLHPMFDDEPRNRPSVVACVDLGWALGAHLAEQGRPCRPAGHRQAVRV